MPTPTLTSRPEKTINGFLSRWNAANLPMIYDIANTKFPVNTDDADETVNSIADNAGFAQLTLNSVTTLVAKDWLTIDAGIYQGIFRIISFQSTTLITINTPFVADDSGTIQKYYNNYVIRVEVFVGIDPTHTLNATDPYSLIGTIDQIPDSTNDTKVDVRKYVKSKLNPTYLLSGNDTNAWKDLYIRFAEAYDEVIGGVVSEFVSQFANDQGEWVHGVFSSLQFGDSRGGNMYDNVVAVTKLDDGQWMTDFESPKNINFDDFSVSIIMDSGADLYGTLFDIETNAFDINGTLLEKQTFEFSNNGYGLYRIVPAYGFIDNNLTHHITIQIEFEGDNISELLTIDVDNTCFIEDTIKTGEISLASDAKIYDSTNADWNSAIKLNDVYAVNAWQGPLSDGFIGIFKYDKYADSTYTNPECVAILEYDTSNSRNNSIIKLDETHVMIFYQSTSNDGKCRIYELTLGDGIEAITPIGSLFTFDASNVFDNSAIVLSDTVVQNYWQGNSVDGFTRTFTINKDTGDIAFFGAVVEFDPVQAQWLNAFTISNIRSVCAWTNTGVTVSIQMFSIDIDGTGDITPLDSVKDLGAGIQISTKFISTTKAIVISDGFIKMVVMNPTTGVIDLFSTLTDTEENGHGEYNSVNIIDDDFMVNVFGDNTDNNVRVQVIAYNQETGDMKLFGDGLSPTIASSAAFNSTINLGDLRIMNFYQDDNSDGTAQIFRLK